MIFLSLIVILSAFCLAIFFGQGDPLLFLDPPSFFITFLPPLILAIFSGYRKTLFLSFRAFNKSEITITHEKLNECIAVIDFMLKTTLASGLVGILIGVVLLLIKLSGSTYGIGISIIIHSILYSSIFSFFIYYPIKTKLKILGLKNL